MRVFRVSIENFLSIGKAELYLADKGLVSVVGRNESDCSANSNGAGKSTIADALSWCLYGITARGVSGDDVINETAGKGCAVSLTLHDDSGSEYLIERFRKHKTGKNDIRISRNGTPLTKGTSKLTQDEIENITGCSYEVFKSSIYYGQEDAPDLPSMTDVPLKALIEQAAGIDRLQRAHDNAKDRLKAANAELNMEQVRAANYTASIDSLEERIGKLEQNSTDYERKVKDDVDKLKLEKQTLRLKIGDLEAKIAKTPTSVLEGKLNDIRNELESFEAEQKELAGLTDYLAKAEKILAAVEVRASQAKSQAAKAKAALDSVESRVGSPCGECGKPYCEDDLHDAKRLAKERFNDALRLYRDEKDALERAQEAVSQARSNAEKFRASMRDSSEIKERQRRLEAALKQVREIESEIQIRTGELKSCDARIDQILTASNPYGKMIESEKAALEGLIEEQKNHASDIERVSKKVVVLKRVVEVFAPSGVRGHILDTVTPFLNNRTAHYLGALSDGNISAIWTTLTEDSKGELKEKFSIQVKKEGASHRFGGLSGGEKRKARLATAMALQELVAARASKSWKLLILDEVDHALDVSGLERLFSIMLDKAKERGTVLVISHNDISAWINNEVMVTNKNGVSSVTGYLSEP